MKRYRLISKCSLLLPNFEDLYIQYALDVERSTGICTDLRVLELSYLGDGSMFARDDLPIDESIRMFDFVDDGKEFDPDFLPP